MKKILLVLIVLMFVTGCGHNSNAIIDSNPDQEYFSMAKDYKKGVSGFYIIGHNDFRIDTDQVELGIMKIASNKYSSSNTYYQTGQYLKRSQLKKIVTEFNKIKINNKSTNLINYIYESNYVGNNSKLKGLSLAINISNELNLKDQQLIEHLEKNIKILLTEIRKNKELANTNIIIGIYKSQLQSSVVPGNYIAWGSTKNNQISFNSINQHTLDLTNANLKEIDENTYQSFYTLSSNLRKKYNNLVISGTAEYEDKNLQQITMNCNVGAMAISNLMAVGEDIIYEINSLFNGDKQIKIVINNDNKDRAFVIFNNKNRNGNIYLLP